MFAPQSKIPSPSHHNHALSRPLKAALAVIVIALCALAAQGWQAGARHGAPGMQAAAALGGVRPAAAPAEVPPSPGSKAWISALLDSYGDSLAAP